MECAIRNEMHEQLSVRLKAREKWKVRAWETASYCLFPARTNNTDRPTIWNMVDRKRDFFDFVTLLWPLTLFWRSAIIDAYRRVFGIYVNHHNFLLILKLALGTYSWVMRLKVIIIRVSIMYHLLLFDFILPRTCASYQSQYTGWPSIEIQSLSSLSIQENREEKKRQ